MRRNAGRERVDLAGIGARAVDPHAAVPAARPAGLLRWPVLLLTVPAALLGLAAFAPWFADRLRVPGDDTGEAVELVHLAPNLILPFLLLVAGAGGAWAGWRRDPAADPARFLGPLRPVFARAFRLDDVQHALVVRPAGALARAVRTGDELGVDGLVEGTGRAAVEAGRRAGRAAPGGAAPRGGRRCWPARC